MARAESLAGLEAKCLKAAEKMGFELVDVCIDQEPTGKYLRIYIDKPEGVSLDDCEAFHKTVRPWADRSSGAGRHNRNCLRQKRPARVPPAPVHESAGLWHTGFP